MQVIYNGEKDTVLFKELLGKTIPELAAQDEDIIYLDADLMGCIGTAKWAAANPTRGINCGISEANMVGTACGLAASGFRPIVHTFGPFASRRVFDQVFLSAGYAGNDITIIGTDPGVCAAFNGGTHMPFEDIALYRTIPTATIIDMTDAAMFKDVFKKLPYLPGVKYVRVGRKSGPAVYADGSTFEIGKGNVLREGKDVTIIACGIMVAMALEAANRLAEEGINASVIDMFTVKPIDKKLVIEYAKKTGAIVTAENHSANGGLTEAVCRAVADECPVPVKHVAIDDLYGQVGPQNFLEKTYDLTPEHIIAEVKAAIERK